MLEQIKTSMRISHNKLDSDIQSNIDTCLLDLKRVGIVKVSQTDKLICKACELYTKYQYNYEQKGEQYEKAYTALRDALSLCGDYNV